MGNSESAEQQQTQFNPNVPRNSNDRSQTKANLGTSSLATSKFSDGSKMEWVKQINDDRYGEIKIYRNNTNGALFAYQSQLYTKNQDFTSYIVRLESYRSLDHPNLLKLVELNKVETENICSSYVKVVTVYEYLNQDLQSQIIQRKQKKRLYTQQDLLAIIYSIGSALHQLSLQKIHHQNISPENILINSNGVYQIMDYSTMTLEPNSYMRFIYGIESDDQCYLSPEALQFVKHRFSQIMFDRVQSDIFSLGLCVLKAAVLQDIKGIYDFDQFEIDLTQLQNLILQASIQYSSKLIDILRYMLEMNPYIRCDSEKLISLLRDNSNNKSKSQLYSNYNMLFENMVDSRTSYSNNHMHPKKSSAHLLSHSSKNESPKRSPSRHQASNNTPSMINNGQPFRDIQNFQIDVEKVGQPKISPTKFNSGPFRNQTISSPLKGVSARSKNSLADARESSRLQLSQSPGSRRSSHQKSNSFEKEQLRVSPQKDIENNQIFDNYQLSQISPTQENSKRFPGETNHNNAFSPSTVKQIPLPESFGSINGHPHGSDSKNSPVSVENSEKDFIYDNRRASAERLRALQSQTFFQNHRGSNYNQNPSQSNMSSKQNSAVQIPVKPNRLDMRDENQRKNSAEKRKSNLTRGNFNRQSREQLLRDQVYIPQSTDFDRFYITSKKYDPNFRNTKPPAAGRQKVNVSDRNSEDYVKDLLKTKRQGTQENLFANYSINNQNIFQLNRIQEPLLEVFYLPLVFLNLL